jgi:hypothetical protein
VTPVLDHWTDLAQSGLLLDRKALEQLPGPSVLGSTFADRLRDALTQLPEEKGASGEVLSKLLDFVLEDTCGLATGWAKGPGVPGEYTERLIDGTELKPRRLLTREGQQVLAVFSTLAERVGLHQGRRPFAHAVEYLRRKKIALGLITNGHEWRLVFADPDNLAWVQWSAERWLDGDKLHATLDLFRRVLAIETLTPGKDGAPSKLLESIRSTRRGQAKLSADLGERVRAAVELLLRCRRPVLEPVWASHVPKAVYIAACHFVMRLVVVLFAEGRELLPVDSPVYHHAYGIRGLIEALERAGLDRRRARTSAWPRLLGLFRLIHGGSLHPQLLVTAYGGDLFRAGDAGGDAVQKALAALEANAEPPDDDLIYNIMILLTRTTERVREGGGWRTVAAPVDFTELTSEYIGILYEGLLDYELHRAGDEPIVFLGLGEQPALPLDRLDQMTEKQLVALLEKAKVKKAGEDEGEDADEDEGQDEGAEEDEGVEEEAAGDATALEVLLPADDRRLKAWERAVKWAERAAVAGKLIKAPKGKAAAQDPAWKAQLDATAKALIVGLKLPGEFYLVRWGGTRKGAGTFYTRPQLTIPTVRRTLEPLLLDCEGKVRTPEELLSLKVCDPAMGSGSFLVAAIRVLTEKIVEALHVHRRIEVVGDHLRISCDLLPDADRDQPEERVEAIVRRAVVEHCIYGVDIDPLAVELARVALWVETLDRRLPFTFLDHKLRCGDALIGTWLDRFRDYPLLAWSRQSPDEKWRGVHHEGDQWAAALSGKRKTVISEQADLLTGQKHLLVASVSDEEIRAAIERVRELYRRLRKVPASQPDKRAEIWRTQVAPDPALARVREAFDTWCALWFWPFDRLAEAPTPNNMLAPSEGSRAVVRSLREERRFFHWELEFPDVFTEKGAGFDAVVGNPPWEIQKPSSKEFFSELDPLYRSYGKQEGLGRQRELFTTNPRTERRWLDYVGRFKDAGNFVRYAAAPFGDAEDRNGKPATFLVERRAEESRKLHKRWANERTKRTGLADPQHPFRHQGSADLNSYKLFVEQAIALLKRGGQLGLLTPSGLYTDKGTADLRRRLLEECSWRWLYGFENRNGIFDIHRSFKFVVTIAQKGGATGALQAAFMRHDLDDWAGAVGALTYPAERIRAFSPKSLSLLEIRTDRDLEVLTTVYANSVLLGDDSAEGWGIKYAREFDMTNDSKLFIPREKAMERGYRPDPYGQWINDRGEVLLPLYEGRMIGHFDFSKKGWVSGKGRAAVWRDIPWEQKVLEPQFLMSRDDFAAARDREGQPKASRGLKLGFMDVGSATNSRTMIAALTFDCPHGNKVPVLMPRGSPKGSAEALCGVLGTFAYDFAMRARLGGLTLNYFIVEETPLPRLVHRALDEVASAARALGMAHVRFAPAWLSQDKAVTQSNAWKALWAVSRYERLRLRCIVDVIVAALYGLTRDDLRWILRDCDHPLTALAEKTHRRALDPKGFWRVDKDLDPELRQTVLTLVAFDALDRAIADNDGDRDAGLRAFMSMNRGEGWKIPEKLRLSDHGLGHDARANEPQPVASRLGRRFLEWQLDQPYEESWAECERHARAVDNAPVRTAGQDSHASEASARPPPGPVRSAASREQADSKANVQRKLFE